MTEQEAYQEHIRYAHDTYCRIVIHHASFDAARMLRRRGTDRHRLWCCCFLDFLVKLRYSETERKQNSTQSEKVNENQWKLRFIIAKPIDFFMRLRYYGTMEVVPMIDRPLYVDKIMPTPTHLL